MARTSKKKSMLVERVETVQDFLRRGGQITKCAPNISRHFTEESAIVARMMGASQADILDPDSRAGFGASVRESLHGAAVADAPFFNYEE